MSAPERSAELLDWTQLGPDATVRLLIGDKERGQMEVVLKLGIQSIVLTGHDAMGWPLLNVQAMTLVRVAHLDPGWKREKKVETRGYG